MLLLTPVTCRHLPCCALLCFVCLVVILLLQALPHVPVIDQLTVNEYTPGVGIAPHVDAHSSFTGSVLSLSLCGSCVMVFRKAYVAVGPQNDKIANSNNNSSSCSSSRRGSEAGSGVGGGSGEEQPQQGEGEQGQDRQVCVFMPPRTLLVMSGEARYAW